MTQITARGRPSRKGESVIATDSSHHRDARHISGNLTSEVTLQRRRGEARDRALRGSLASGAFVRLLSTAAQFASFGVAARALGELRFGLFATISALIGLMSFADLGIGSGLMTKLAASSGHDDDCSQRAVVSTALMGMLLLGGITAILAIPSSKLLPWNRILGTSDLPPHEVTVSVAVLLICIGVAIPSALGQRILIGLQRGTVANAWLLAGSVASLTSVLVVAQVELPLWCYVVATFGTPSCVGVGCSLWVVLRAHPELCPRVTLLSRGSVQDLASISGLFLVLNITVAVAYQGDVVIVASTLGASSAATFAIGAKMFGVLTGTLAAASQQVWTSMAEAMARGDHAWVRSRFTRMLLATLGISIPAVVSVVALGQSAARLWVGASVAPTTSLLAVMGVWAVYSLVMTQVGYLLNAAQIVGPQVLMAGLMGVANVVLSIYLTRRVGIAGPVLGSLLGHFVFSGLPSIALAFRLLRTNRPAMANA